MFNKKKPYVLVFGASIVDITGFSAVKYRQFNSNPGFVKISYGGVCRNIADNLSRVGVNTKFISILGNDEAGRSMMDHSKTVGYCMEDSLILKNHGTPTYMVILDHEGEMVSAVVDMKGINEADECFIDSKMESFEHAEYIVVDADSPLLLEYMLNKFPKAKFILDPVSAAKSEGIKHLISKFHTVKPNIHEAEILTGMEIKTEEDMIHAADYLHNLGITNVFISLGEEGIFYSNTSEKGKVKAQDVFAVNVTGAGDSLVAGICYGYMNGLKLRELVKFSITMSVLTVCHEETINPTMSEDKVKTTIDRILWEESTYVYGE